MTQQFVEPEQNPDERNDDMSEDSVREDELEDEDIPMPQESADADDDDEYDVTRYVQGTILKTDHIEPGQTEHFQITAVGWITYEAKDGRRAEKKPLLDFDDGRQWALNKTNTETVSHAWGFDMRQWVGKGLGIHHDRTIKDPSGRRSGGLRVRIES